MADDVQSDPDVGDLHVLRLFFQSAGTKDYGKSETAQLEERPDRLQLRPDHIQRLDILRVLDERMVGQLQFQMPTCGLLNK